MHKRYQEALPSTSTMSGRDFLDKLGSLPLLYQPGTVWDYGYSIDVVGLMVERVSGQSLGGILGIACSSLSA